MIHRWFVRHFFLTAIKYAANLALLTLVLLFGRASAQTIPLSAGAIPLTVTADSLVNLDRNGIAIQQLIGNVQFYQGSLYGSADRATRYVSQNMIELTGHVVIHQDTLSLEAPTVSFDGFDRIGHAEGGVTLKDRSATLTAATGDYDAGAEIAIFHKNVRIIDGRNMIDADNLTYYRTTQTSIATGNVVARNDSGRLSADHLTYSKALDETLAKGNVQLSTDSLAMSADWLYQSRPNGILRASGNVGLRVRSANATFYDDSLFRSEAEGKIVLPIRPIAILIDSSKTADSSGAFTLDTTFLRGSRMTAYEGDTTRFVVADSVLLLGKSIRARTKLLDYNRATSLMTLSGGLRQHAWSDSTELGADSIAVIFRGDEIDRLRSIGHAFTSTPMADSLAGGRYQQLKGDNIEMRLTGDTVREIRSENGAMSMYFLVNNGAPDGVNRVSGDTIRIGFEHKKVDRITIIGGTEGEYWPEQFVTGRGAAFRFPEFERNPNLRPTRADFAVPPTSLPDYFRSTLP